MHLYKKYNHWQIAYRLKGMNRFTLIPNPTYGWAADPFLIEYQQELYLFAEIFLYKSERKGVIGYCKYQDGKFGEWNITMDKHWHLSYPFVFVQNGKLYMCPEAIQSEEISIYELIEFPDKWKKVKTLLQNGRYADTTPFLYENENYLFTFIHTEDSLIKGTLYIYKWEENDSFLCRKISSDIGNARPGGKIIYKDNKLIRVSQNSNGGYGTGLVFSLIDNVWPIYQEHVLKTIYPADLDIECKEKYIGIHTYNSCGDMEVIDLKYATFSFTEYWAQKRVRKIFLNKY